MQKNNFRLHLHNGRPRNQDAVPAEWGPQPRAVVPSRPDLPLSWILVDNGVGGHRYIKSNL